MQNEATILLSDVVREAAHPLFGEVDDYNPLLQMIWGIGEVPETFPTGV